MPTMAKHVIDMTVDFVRSRLTQTNRHATLRRELENVAVSDRVAEVVTKEKLCSSGDAVSFGDGDRHKGQNLSSPQHPTLGEECFVRVAQVDRARIDRPRAELNGGDPWGEEPRIEAKQPLDQRRPVRVR